MDINGLAEKAIEGIVSANLTNFTPYRLLIGKAPVSQIKAFNRTLPFRPLIKSMGISIQYLYHLDGNYDLLGEYNQENKNVINLYSFSKQVWLHEVVHAVDDRLFGMRKRADQAGDNLLSWTHENIADLGAVMLMLSTSGTADFQFAKRRILDYTLKDINERGLEVEGVPFESDEDKVRWVCRKAKPTACQVVQFILNWR